MEKTVYFLGAGFSSIAGIPKQCDLLPEIFRADEPNIIKRREEVKKFLEKIFNCDCSDKFFPTLEDVFSSLDQGIKNGEYIKTYSPIKLHEIRRNLSYCIVKLIDHKANRPDIVNKFAKALVDTRLKVGQGEDPFAIITTNWDKIMINALAEAQKKKIEDIMGNKYSSLIQIPYDKRPYVPLTDFCIYTHVKEKYKDNHIPSLQIKASNFSNVKLLHLHGTAGWKFCPSCGRIFSSPSYDKDGTGEKEVIGAMEGEQCSYCKKNFDGKKGDLPKLEPLLVMPTLFKEISNIHLKDIWQSAAIEISQASRLVIVGYSLPQADFHIRNLLIKNINDKKIKRIEIILKGEKDIRRDIERELGNDKKEIKKGIEKYKKERKQNYLRFFGNGINRCKPDIEFIGANKFLENEIKLLTKNS